MAIQPTDPAARGKAVGIDLGTTNSLVAYVEGRGAQVACFTVDEGSRLLPSAVAYLDEQVIVGGEAKRLSEKHPREVILSAKRFVGKSANDPEVRKLSPYAFDPESDNVIRFVIGERKITPVEVSAEILRRLKSEAERTLGKVTQAVVTVPAYFDDAQRQATKDAGKLAGLDVLRLLNEPTAAALAYGLDTKKDGVFAVYDLGGGTFDISILELDDGVFQVRSTAGDSALGGDDFDRALAQQFLTKLGADAHTDPHLVRHAIDAAKSAKEALTDAATTTVELTNGTTSRFELTRDELEAAMRPILERSRQPCERALHDAGVDGPIDGVVLVGGSTRSPLVRRFVEELFGLKPLFDHDPDEVVALGAAIQANQLAGDVKAHDDILLLDVNPLSLGVETMGGLVEKIIPRNSNIPVAMQQTFTTFVDGQTALDIHVLQGEREFVQDCRSLARFTLRGIPPMPAGMGRVEITFQVDADGLLTVLAKEEVTGVEQSVIVRPSHGLTDSEVERMLRESFEFGEEDVALRLLVEARVDAKRILDAAQKQLDQNPDLVSDEERATIEAAMQAVNDAAQGDEHGPINDLVLALDQASAEFAQRIMNRGMQKSLGGRSIAEYDSTTGKDENRQEPKMAKVTYRFEGREIVTEVKPGTNLLDAALDAGAREGHACGGVCACSTCHIYVTKGFESLVEADDDEQDILDKAFDVKWNSRLGCQAEVGTEDVEVDISEESLQAWYDENPVERKERDEKLKAEGKKIPGPARDVRNG